jgi:hypothetical protein
MSIWGSIIGGFVGFSFAGPIGALIGSMGPANEKPTNPPIILPHMLMKKF